MRCVRRVLIVSSCRLELETRLQDFARQRIDEEAVLHAEREKLQQQMTLAGDAKDDAVREAQMSR